MEEQRQQLTCLIRSWQNNQGTFSANAHEYFRFKSVSIQWDGMVWESWSLPRHSFILWLVALGKLKTRDRLQFLSTDTQCALYGQEEESHSHLFFACDWTSLLWRKVESWLRITRNMGTLNSAIRGLTSNKKGLQLRMRRVSLALVVYLIWEERNRRIFDNIDKSINLIYISQVSDYVPHNPVFS